MIVPPNFDTVDTLIVHTHIVITKFIAPLKRKLIKYVTRTVSEIIRGCMFTLSELLFYR